MKSTSDLLTFDPAQVQAHAAAAPEAADGAGEQAQVGDGRAPAEAGQGAGGAAGELLRGGGQADQETPRHPGQGGEEGEEGEGEEEGGFIWMDNRRRKGLSRWEQEM